MKAPKNAKIIDLNQLEYRLSAHLLIRASNFKPGSKLTYTCLYNLELDVIRSGIRLIATIIAARSFISHNAEGI